MTAPETSTTSPRPASKSALMIIFVTVFIDLLGFGIVMPLLPRYGKYFGAEKLTLGMLLASFSAMQFLFAPLWGRLSDRIGRRPVLLLGLAGSAVSYGLFGFATSLGKDGLLLGLSALPWFFITRIGAGIAGATIPTAQAYIADSTTRETRGKGMALIGAAFGVGFTFGPLLGSLFAAKSLDAPPAAAVGYIASGLSALAFLWALARLPETLKAESAPARSGLWHLKALGSALSQPSIGLVLLTMFLTTFAFAQFESTLSLLTQHFGLPDGDNFYVFAYVGFVLTLSQGFLVRRLSPKLGDFRMSLIGTGLMTVGLVLIAFIANQKSTGLLYAILPVCVTGFSALNPSLQALLSLRSGADQQGEMLGVGQSMAALARILGPVAGLSMFSVGEKREAIGVGLPYWVGAGLMLLGVLMVLTLRSPRTPAASREA